MLAECYRLHLFPSSTPRQTTAAAERLSAFSFSMFSAEVLASVAHIRGKTMQPKERRENAFFQLDEVSVFSGAAAYRPRSGVTYSASRHRHAAPTQSEARALRPPQHLRSRHFAGATTPATTP